MFSKTAFSFYERWVRNKLINLEELPSLNIFKSLLQTALKQTWCCFYMTNQLRYQWLACTFLIFYSSYCSALIYCLCFYQAILFSSVCVTSCAVSWPGLVCISMGPSWMNKGAIQKLIYMKENNKWKKYLYVQNHSKLQGFKIHSANYAISFHYTLLFSSYSLVQLLMYLIVLVTI